MMNIPVTSLEFTVRRSLPELIVPARPTPRELKRLSDIDDQECFRYHIDVMYFYGGDAVHGRDPVAVIRAALAEALVFYYPFAGRMREAAGRKLYVDCTGEGIGFVEAEADAEVSQFGDPPRPPFPGVKELLYHGSEEILDTPLFYVQVPRLKCKGFVVGLRYNHTIADGFGFVQFWRAVGELAEGATSLSVPPVWGREVFYARDNPRVTCTHPEYDKNTGLIAPFKENDDVVERSFVFTSSHMSTLRALLPDHLGHCTKFEILTACVWLCRVRALELNPNDQVRINFTVNSRGSWLHPPLPAGYYGNAFAIPTAVTTAGSLSFERALKLVREAKASVTTEYMQSTADLLVTRGRPYLSMDGANCFFVSDTSHFFVEDVKFGLGRPLFEGPSSTEEGLFSYYMLVKNKEGEVGRLVTIGMPSRAMNNFIKELDGMLGPKPSVTSRL